MIPISKIIRFNDVTGYNLPLTDPYNYYSGENYESEIEKLGRKYKEIRNFEINDVKCRARYDEWFGSETGINISNGNTNIVTKELNTISNSSVANIINEYSRLYNELRNDGNDAAGGAKLTNAPPISVRAFYGEKDTKGSSWLSGGSRVFLPILLSAPLTNITQKESPYKEITFGDLFRFYKRLTKV